MVRIFRDTVNHSGSGLPKPYRINTGDRIAQAMIIPIPKVSFVEVTELKTTARGVGGFGSTGA